MTNEDDLIEKSKKSDKSKKKKKKTVRFETKPISQNLSEKFVQDVTLEFMGNDHFNKATSSSNIYQTSIKNKKFYRKRIIQLTKDLLSLEEENKESYSPDLYKSFYKFINISIDYFQTIDKTDIIQEDYKDLEDSITKFDDILGTEENDSSDSLLNANKQMMRQIHLKTATLDGLVKRTLIKKEEPILPKKKKINLKDPELKNKGVIKKNNNNLTNN